MPRKIAYALAATPGGAVVASTNNVIDVFAHDGDASLEADLDTDGEGLWTWTFAPTGSAGAGWVIDPGPVYWVGTHGSRVRRGSSKSGGAVGPNSLLELPVLFSAWGDGVVADQLNELEVTLDGAGMDCDINTGYALLDGQLVCLPSAKELTVTAADGTHPRIDRVILERVRTAGDTEGKVTLKMLDGTAAASPAAPDLTDDADTLQVSLAQVRSNAGVTTPTSVTDERDYALTGVARNPTLFDSELDAPGATELTTSPDHLNGAITASVTLVSGVWYTLIAECELIVDGDAATAQLAAWIDSTSDASEYATAPAQEGLITLFNVHTARLLGDGGAVEAGPLAKKSSSASTVNWYSGSCHVTAIPE